MKKINDIEVFSPVEGIVGNLKEVPDEVFANDILGKSIVLKSDSDYIFSPIKGIIQTAFPTGHAYGIVSDHGPSLLLHIGVDTVLLEGEGFIRLVMQNDKVNIKTKLVRVDWGKLKKAKSSDIIITALDDSMAGFKIEMTLKPGDIVKQGDLLFKIVKENNE